jgi:hypothetical protein
MIFNKLFNNLPNHPKNLILITCLVTQKKSTVFFYKIKVIFLCLKKNYINVF